MKTQGGRREGRKETRKKILKICNLNELQSTVQNLYTQEKLKTHTRTNTE